MRSIVNFSDREMFRKFIPWFISPRQDLTCGIHPSAHDSVLETRAKQVINARTYCALFWSSASFLTFVILTRACVWWRENVNLNSQSDAGKCKVYFAIAIGRGEGIQSLHSASKNSSQCTLRPLSTSLKRAQLFQLDASTQIQLQKEKTRDFISI